MKQIRIPATFMRGGTSNAVVFRAQDLPDRPLWDEIFLAALGSPDPYARQLDGMGGGVSSLSKVCVVGPSSRPDADIDYTKAQIQLREARVDYSTNCGNMSAAMGPFAVDEGMVKVSGSEALVRIHNTNTKKLIHAYFPLDGGLAAVDGDLVIPGVAGSGAPIRLEFRDPGGATTGKLLPTGNVADTLEVPGVGKVRCSMVDAANACVFVRAADIGLKGTELPADLEGRPEVMQRLAAIRVAASVAMGITRTPDEASRKSAPLVGFMSPPQDSPSLTGETTRAADVDLTARMISNGQPHRALPLTASLCIAVASRIAGSIVHEATRAISNPDAPIRLAMPSGVLMVTAQVTQAADGRWHAEQGGFYRTARRMFDGHVLVRASRVPGVVAAQMLK